MKLRTRIALAIALLTALCSAATAQQFLPKSFAGWTQTGDVKTLRQPEQADAAYPAVLREYGFTESETVTYTRADGRTLTVKATQFKDATGAYGAFTFYRGSGDEDRTDRDQGSVGQSSASCSFAATCWWMRRSTESRECRRLNCASWRAYCRK